MLLSRFINYEIYFKKGTLSFAKKIYDMFKKQTLIIKEYIDEMLKKKYIRLSTSFYVVFILIVKKFNKGFRFYVNY